MQYGGEIVDTSEQKAVLNVSINKEDKKIVPGEEALGFYTQFNDPYSRYYTWNDNFADSGIAFSRGETVMMIGYNQAKETIDKYGANLNYGIAPLPQFANSPSIINYGQTMTLAVLKNSSHHQESWNFLKFLSQKNNAQNYFLQTKNLPTRLDLIQEYLNDLDSGIFIREIGTSRNWYQYDFQSINTVFKEMIEAVTYKGDTPSKAVSTAVEKINYFWSQK
jgi:ABC-type glycerol-3-phosphate transport system substrate-binding protein